VIRIYNSKFSRGYYYIVGDYTHVMYIYTLYTATVYVYELYSVINIH